MLEVGMKNSSSIVVTPENTAARLRSGTLDVFATPAMIALIEETCWKMVQPELEEGAGTVGTKVNINHTAPSVIGKTVRCEAVLTEIDRRKLTFEVICTDENGTVGWGLHERFIIDNARFMDEASKQSPQ